jgi:hypothetical protein
MKKIRANIKLFSGLYYSRSFPDYLYLLFIFFAVNGCKYEDGPGISFKSACKRVEGTYFIDKFEVNHQDSIGLLNSLNCNGNVIFYDKSRVGVNINISSCRDGGTFDLRNSNRNIAIQFLGYGHKFGYPPWDGGYTATWDIVELKDESMTFETQFNGHHIKIRLKE